MQLVIPSPIEQRDPNLQGLKSKSKLFPPSAFNKSAGLFLQLVTAELETLGKCHPTDPSLSPTYRKALNNLQFEE